MRRLLAALFLASCATTQATPTEKTAFDYTQAFLRRDSAQMNSMGTSEVQHPTPSAYYATLKAVRTCPPQGAEGGPEAQAILVLMGATSNQYFEAMKITVAHYGEQWLVVDAQRVMAPTGMPLMYSRSCIPVYGTYGGGGSY
jgi:hypothetical protein